MAVSTQAILDIAKSKDLACSHDVARFIADALNLFEEEINIYISLDSIVPEIAIFTLRLFASTAGGAQELLDSVVRALNGTYGIDVDPDGARALLQRTFLPLPPPNPFREQQRLRALRTNKSKDAGARLLRAARAMEGRFRWVPSGPDDQTFHLSERTSRGYNDFARWILRGGIEPHEYSAMNCWEVVFFSAYKANLKSKFDLELLHRAAGQWARGVNSPYTYTPRLMSSLDYFNAFKLDPGAGLHPKAGDIVFVGGDHHVAIYAETRWTLGGGQPQHMVMSLWRHPRDGFNLVEVEDVRGTLKVEFVPCPF